MRIALIGCGFLGSIFLEELLKRLYAANRKDVEFVIIDMDKFEERNAANQNCRPSHADKYKVLVMREMIANYGFERVPGCTDDELTEKNAKLLLDDSVDLVIDALDNLPTRHVVYFRAMELSIPSLHLGVDEYGDGTVEWVVPPKYDSWHLSPKVLRIYPQADQTKEPPCRLVRMRGVGLNLGLAAAKAVTLALKEDIEEYFMAGPHLPGPVYTNWSANSFGHHLEGSPYVEAVEEEKEEETSGQEPLAGTESESQGSQLQPDWSKERNA